MPNTQQPITYATLINMINKAVRDAPDDACRMLAADVLYGDIVDVDSEVDHIEGTLSTVRFVGLGCLAEEFEIEQDDYLDNGTIACLIDSELEESTTLRGMRMHDTNGDIVYLIYKM